jgi:endonuclease III
MSEENRAAARRRRAKTPVEASLAPVLTAAARPKPSGTRRGGPTVPAPLRDAELREAFVRLRTASPDPRPELEFKNPYTLLVAVALSAQATDRSVNLATRPLFKVADTPEAMLALGEERLREFIRTIGLFNTKARNVIALSRRLVEEFGGEVPRDVEVLATLPGVGPKTASVVANVAFGEPRIAVDTHIFRVSNRLPLAPGRTADQVQAGLEARVPEEFRLNAHHWLILHGRYTCVARKPACPRCILLDLCRFPEKTASA